MKIEVKRLHHTEKSTIGEVYVNGVFECYSCEDIEREGESKVAGKTAIPKGTYDVIINMSNRFQRQMPLLLNVPNFAGVRIHPGNTAQDTEGCILVGRTRSVDFVGESRKAYTKLFEKMLLAKEPITITIESNSNLNGSV
ncbi:MAG: hypothetical protein H7Z76_10135 [Methylotenera sp.]|nr:hypothetical protein [Flavobacterium sp.]